MVEGTVVRLCREVVDELEGPAESDDVGVGIETREEAVVVAAPSTKAATIGREGYARDDGKVDGLEVGKDRT